MKHIKRILIFFFPALALFILFLEFGGKYFLSNEEKTMIGWSMTMGSRLPADFNNFYNTVYPNSLEKNTWEIITNPTAVSRKNCPCSQMAYSIYPHIKFKIISPLKYILVSRYLEHHYTQRQCLNYNFNNFNFLENRIGIDQISKSLFNKSVKDLKPVEMAEILALYEGPLRNNRNRNPERAKVRARHFLNLYEKNVNK